MIVIKVENEDWPLLTIEDGGVVKLYKEGGELWKEARLKDCPEFREENVWEIVLQSLDLTLGMGAKPPEGAGAIYALADPDTLQIRYVGQTKGPLIQRLRKHISKAKREARTHAQRWLNSLMDRPAMVLLDEVPLDEIDQTERVWIAAFRKDGFDLTNIADGGAGGGPFRGRKATPEHRAKISAAHTGRPKSEEHRKHLSESRAGRYVGENGPLAKLNNSQVRDIKRRYAAGGISYQRLADEFGVSESAIGAIVTGITWKHIQIEED